MEVFLFTLFFIVSLIFFVSGKDDFGRKEKRIIIKSMGKEEVKKELGMEQKDEIKKEVELEST